MKKVYSVRRRPKAGGAENGPCAAESSKPFSFPLVKGHGDSTFLWPISKFPKILTPPSPDIPTILPSCQAEASANWIGGTGARHGRPMEPKFRESCPCFKENGRPTATAARNSENVFPSLGGIREYVLARTKFQWCGFDVFVAARRRVKSGFKAVSRSSKFRESLPQRRV